MGAEHDRLSGGGGNDTLAAGYGDDVDGGTGTDTLSLSLGGAGGGVVFDTTGITGATPFRFADGTIQNVETLTYLRGSEFGDTLSIATQTSGLDVDGGGGDDVIVAHSSTVHAIGGEGNDRFVSGPAGDTFDGGMGIDTIDYSAAGSGVTVTFGARQDRRGSGPGGDTFVNVEGVIGSAFADTITGSGGADTIDGGGGSDTLTGGAGDDTYIVNNSGVTIVETSGGGTDTVRTSLASYVLPTNVERLIYTGLGAATLTGNAGDNAVTLGNGGGSVDLSQGGNDTATGGAGNDAFYFGAALTGADRIDGGAGSNDQVGISGDYTGANRLVLAGATLTNIEVLAALPGHSYDITTADGNVAAGGLLTIFGGNLGAGENFTFDGSAETDGALRVYGGLGTDILTGGAGNDGFYFGPGKFGASDQVHGGGGTNDQLALDGDYTVTIDARFDVEVAVLLGGPVGSPNHFSVTVSDAFVASGAAKTIFATAVTMPLMIDASGEHDGRLTIYGGQAGDVITGTNGADTIFGNGGGDTLTGGAGADVFLYDAASQSTSTGYDTLTDFTYGSDTIKITGQTHDTYASVTGGTLSTATFDADLATALNAQLTGGAAVFFSPDAGTLAGEMFLVVDANGVAGYQAGGDYVFHMPSVEPVPGAPDFII